MARKKSSGASIGATKKKIEKVTADTKKILAAKKAIEQKKALEKRLTQKLTALANAKKALAGTKARIKKRK